MCAHWPIGLGMCKNETQKREWGSDNSGGRKTTSIMCLLLLTVSGHVNKAIYLFLFLAVGEQKIVFLRDSIRTPAVSASLTASSHPAATLPSTKSPLQNKDCKPANPSDHVVFKAQRQKFCLEKGGTFSRLIVFSASTHSVVRTMYKCAGQQETAKKKKALRSFV